MRVETATRFPDHCAGVALERGEAGGILVDGSCRRHQLNDTAMALWELCDGTTTVDEMVEAITILFRESRASIHRDVGATLRHFTEAGLIVWK